MNILGMIIISIGITILSHNNKEIIA
jgi:hypothetical protein